MIARWTSLVPSQIRSTRSSRKNRSATFSRMYPRPPKTWTARSATRPAISDAYSLAIEHCACWTLTSAPASMPRAVSYTSDRAANSSVRLSASIAWIAPSSAIGPPCTCRPAANSVISCVSRAAGDQEAGVWEWAPGPSYWKLETHEFVHIVAGRMTVTPDGGESRDIGPGDTAVFPRGWAGTWQIHEKIRKVYVIF
jgi:uncharacterized cupin superfamily protein